MLLDKLFLSHNNDFKGLQLINLCNGACTITDMTTWIVYGVIVLSAVLGFVAGGD